MVPTPTRPGVSRPRPKTENRVETALTLARWRLRRSWWLLLLTCLGLIAAMITACVVPLFTAVSAASSLQNLFQVSATRSQVTIDAEMQGLSTHILQTIQPQLLSP